MPSKFKFDKICSTHKLFRTESHYCGVRGDKIQIHNKNLRATFEHSSLKILRFHSIICDFLFIQHKCFY